MMKRFLRSFAVVLALAVPIGTASAATNIACVEEGYTPEEIATFDRFYQEFRPTGLERQSLPADIFTAVGRRVGECAELHTWPPEALEDATLYRVAFIMRIALNRQSPLTSAQARRLDEAISSVDQSRLNGIVGRMLDSSMEGTSSEPTRADNVFLGRLILRAGLPTTEAIAHYVGAYIGVRILVEQTRQRFESR